MILLLWLLKKKMSFRVAERAFDKLYGALAVILCIDAFFIICEIVTMLYPGASGAETAKVILFGSLAPLFWFEAIAGLVLPILAFAIPKLRAKKGLPIAACGLVLLGVACKRLWLLLSGYSIPNIVGGNGITLGNQNVIAANGGNIWSTVGVYSATVPEVLISIGVVAFGVLAFIVLMSKLSSKDPE